MISMSMSAQSRAVVDLPYVDIQHDALTVFEDVEQGTVSHEDIWISGYKRGETSVHGRARVSKSEGGGSEFVPRDGADLKKISKTEFVVSFPALGIENLPVKYPRQVIHPPYIKKALDAPLHINALSLNPKTPHVVVGGPDGYAVILPTGLGANMEKECVRLKGHVGDVRDVKWFPSGEVILTASSDLSLRIFGKDGINPRTLRGHTRAITSTEIIGVGKQVVSGSKDGTLRLWDVGKGAEVRKWLVGGDKRRGVEGFVLIDKGFEETFRAREGKKSSDGERKGFLVATQDAVWVQPWSQAENASGEEGQGGKDGEREGEGEGWLVPNESVGVTSQLVCLAYDQQTGAVVTGHTDGTIVVRHVSSLQRPIAATPVPDATAQAQDPNRSQYTSEESSRQRDITVVRRNEASVYSLAFAHHSDSEKSGEGEDEAEDGPVDLYVGTAAGLPARLSVKREEKAKGEASGWEIKVVEELAGWEAVGVETWGMGREGVWCAGGEGGLRRY